MLSQEVTHSHFIQVQASHMTTPSLNSLREVSFLLCSERVENSINVSYIVCDRNVFISLSYFCSDLRWKRKANIMFLRGNQGSHISEKKYISHSDLKFILKWRRQPLGSQSPFKHGYNFMTFPIKLKVTHCMTETKTVCSPLVWTL